MCMKKFISVKEPMIPWKRLIRPLRGFIDDMEANLPMKAFHEAEMLARERRTQRCLCEDVRSIPGLAQWVKDPPQAVE